ncbi:MAG TPA: tetratricopeptide repeat protein, partial [Thioalkalivibrio sp.]|nr:tetratricopeptide repeat protein [Thioalkalivibrio sp.]
YARGLVHERADDIPAAEEDFRSILEQDPDNASALNALGYTLADRTERYEEAYALIIRADELRPDDAAITDSYGWVLYRLGRLDEAVVKLRQAYALFPDGEIASNLAVVLWELGEREESRAILDEALQREPDHERLLRVRRQLVD